MYVSEYPITEYKCGLRAGDKVRLKRDLVVQDQKGNATGERHPKGEIWTVLPEAKDSRVDVWFHQANGERHTWNDDDNIYEWFEQVSG